jgi:Leu/Phe-tRNA-protein transferase
MQEPYRSRPYPYSTSEKHSHSVLLLEDDELLHRLVGVTCGGIGIGQSQFVLKLCTALRGTVDMVVRLGGCGVSWLP